MSGANLWLLAALAISGWGIAGAIVVHAITSWSDERRGIRQYPEHNNETTHEGDSPAHDQQPAGIVLKPPITKPNSDEQRHRGEERRFWERQIRVSKGLNWITLAAAVVAAGGLLALYRSIVDAEDATVRANRAWLLADGPNAPTGKSPAGTVVIEEFVNITNVGREPASDVRNYLRTFWLTPVTHTKEDGTIGVDMRKQSYQLNDTCDYTSDGPQMGTIFPRPAPYVANGDREQVKSGLFGFQGCVSYTTFGTRHYTRFCFILANNWSVCEGEGQEWAN